MTGILKLDGSKFWSKQSVDSAFLGDIILMPY